MLCSTRDPARFVRTPPRLASGEAAAWLDRAPVALDASVDRRPGLGGPHPRAPGARVPALLGPEPRCARRASGSTTVRDSVGGSLHGRDHARALAPRAASARADPGPRRGPSSHAARLAPGHPASRTRPWRGRSARSASLQDLLRPAARQPTSTACAPCWVPPADAPVPALSATFLPDGHVGAPAVRWGRTGAFPGRIRALRRWAARG